MSFRNTIILAVIVAALGAYLYWVERPAVEREEQAGKLLELDRDAVAKLHVESPKGKLDLEKVDGKWKITSPLAADADQTTVDNLIRALADGEVKKTVDESPADLKPYGLDPPETTVVLTLEGGRTAKVELGKKTPIGFSAYAQRNDEPAVLLTTDAVRTGMQKELADVRDKTVLEFADADVQEITIGGVEPTPVVLRKEGAEWMLAGDPARKADAAQVRSLLASLRSLRATGFIDDAGSPPDAKYNLTPPRVTVELVVGSDETKTSLLVGGATDEPAKREIYVQSNAASTVYRVGSHLFSAVSKKGEDFRDKTVLAFDPDQATSVTVERADGNGFTLEKKDDKWTVADAGDAKVKEFVASRLVDDVRGLKGVSIASEDGPKPEFGLDQPLETIRVRGAGGDIGTIRIARAGEGESKTLYAAADGSPTVYVLQDYVFQRVDKKRADFVEAAPAPGASPGAADEAGGEEPEEIDLDVDVLPAPPPE
ncbi:MAG: DUF4340 domain-containing protein [Thermodesulfobacteriota bacterium]